MFDYYVVIVILGVANLLLAVIAFFQRSKQIRGNRLREHQLALAEARNDLAQRRLERLNDQLALLSDIRDALRANAASHSHVRIVERSPHAMENVGATSPTARTRSESSPQVR